MDMKQRDHGICICGAEGLNTDEPLVSVIIPVYNVSRYLPQCLESVLSQTWHRLEVIVIDDGSTDSSGQICDQYAERDDRICVIHTQNKGLAAARNLGLESSRGQFISFIDSDDWIEPHTIETFIREALLTGSDIVIAGYCKEYVGKTVHHSKGKDYSQTCRGRDILAAFAEGRFRNVAWNKFYRAECFADLRFPDGHNYEDIAVLWKLMKELAESGKAVTVLPDELIHFRVRKSSISHVWTPRNLTDSWRARRAKYEALPEYQEMLLAECFASILRMWLAFFGYTEEEKAESEKTVREMQAFSKKNFTRVLKGKYPKYTTAACLLSQSRSMPVMWIGFCGGKVREALRSRKYIMFD